MLEGMLDLTVFGVTGGEVRLAMVMVVDGGGKGRRGGDEGEGAVGGRQKVDMVDMHGYGNAVGRRISCVCVCVYILSPLSVLARRYLPLQSQAWGHHVEVFAYTDRDLSICTIIVGGTPSTESDCILYLSMYP